MLASDAHASGRRGAQGPGGDEVDLVAARTDPAAFVAFYLRRRSRVAAYFHRRICCPSTAAELTAETFARVWAGRDRFDPEQGSALGWTMGIASNLYKQWSRRGSVDQLTRARLHAVTRDVVLEDLDRIEGLVDQREQRALLRGGLEDLSPRVREAVLLRVGMDLPYDDVARRLGCSTGAARVRVSRGVEALRALRRRERGSAPNDRRAATR